MEPNKDKIKLVLDPAWWHLSQAGCTQCLVAGNRVSSSLIAPRLVRAKRNIAPSRRRVPLLGWFERFSGTSSSVLPLVSWISLRNQAIICPRKNKKKFFLKSCCYITGVCRTFPITQLVCVSLNSVWWDFPPIKESHSVTPKSGNLNNPWFYAEIPEGLKVPRLHFKLGLINFFSIVKTTTSLLTIKIKPPLLFLHRLKHQKT